MMDKSEFEKMIPDPEVNFEGCVGAIADQVTAELAREFPPNMTEAAKLRRLLARAGERYLTHLLPTGFWPDVLTRIDRKCLDRAAVRYVRWMEAHGELPDMDKPMEGENDKTVS